MHTALLRGREHATLGGVAAVSEGRVAIALSVGGAPKRYGHVDPNEDVVGFAHGEGGALLAVADGHFGCDAAELAVERILAHYAPRWISAEMPGADWASLGRDALVAIHTAILEGAVAGRIRDTARTTLSLALVRPADDLLAFAAVGDSHVFHVGEKEAVDLAFDDAQPGFLGYPADDADDIRAACAVGAERLDGARGLVLATDGISEMGIGVDDPELCVFACFERAAGAVPDLVPLELARGVVEEALESHRRQRAGDNVAAAVLWLPTHAG